MRTDVALIDVMLIHRTFLLPFAIHICKVFGAAIEEVVAGGPDYYAEVVCETVDKICNDRSAHVYVLRTTFRYMANSRRPAALYSAIIAPCHVADHCIILHENKSSYSNASAVPLQQWIASVVAQLKQQEHALYS